LVKRLRVQQHNHQKYSEDIEVHSVLSRGGVAFSPPKQSIKTPTEFEICNARNQWSFYQSVFCCVL